jgi:hypothetical protein
VVAEIVASATTRRVGPGSVGGVGSEERASFAGADEAVGGWGTWFLIEDKRDDMLISEQYGVRDVLVSLGLNHGD